MKMKRAVLFGAAIFAAIAFCGAARAVAAEASPEGKFKSAVVGEILKEAAGRKFIVGARQVVAAVEKAAKKSGNDVVAIPVDARDKSWAKNVIPLAGDNPRLLAAIDMGQLFFARMWIHENGPQDVALLMLPGIFAAEGYAPEYRGLVTVSDGKKELDEAALDKMYAASERAWDDFGEKFVEAPMEEQQNDPWASFARGQLSINANNLGTTLEYAGDKERAFECYVRAGTLNPRSVSALLNKASLVKRGEHEELIPELTQALADFNANKPNVKVLGNLAQASGYVADPKPFVPLGFEWAITGIPACENARWTEAKAMVTNTAMTAALDKMVGDAHDGELGFTEKPFQMIIRACSGDARESLSGIIEVARVFALRPDKESMEKYLKIAEGMGAAKEEIDGVRAELDARNEPAKPMTDLLFDAAQKAPGSDVLWAQLLVVTPLDKIAETVGRAMPLMKAASPRPKVAMELAEGMRSLAKNSRVIGRDHLAKALELDPAISSLIADMYLLPLDFQMGDKAAAEKHANLILATQPNAAMANYILGSLAFGEGNYEKAEEYLKRSIARPTVPALNDYACVLLKLNRAAEAEPVIRKAMEMGGAQVAAIWDTAADVFEAQGKITDADIAYDNVLKLDERQISPDMFMKCAKSLLRRGDAAKAKEAAQKAHAIRFQMGADGREELSRLIRKIDETLAGKPPAD